MARWSVLGRGTVVAAVAACWFVAGAAFAASAGADALDVAPGPMTASSLTGLDSTIAAAARTGDRSAVGRALLSAQVFVAVTPAGAEAVQKDGQVDIAVRAVTLEDGSTAMAVFSSPAKLHEAFGPDAAVIALDGRSALAVYGLDQIVLDYGSDAQLLWRPVDTEELLNQGG